MWMVSEISNEACETSKVYVCVWLAVYFRNEFVFAQWETILKCFSNFSRKFFVEILAQQNLTEVRTASLIA